MEVDDEIESPQKKSPVETKRKQAGKRGAKVVDATPEEDETGLIKERPKDPD